MEKDMAARLVTSTILEMHRKIESLELVGRIPRSNFKSQLLEEVAPVECTKLPESLFSWGHLTHREMEDLSRLDLLSELPYHPEGEPQVVVGVAEAPTPSPSSSFFPSTLPNGLLLILAGVLLCYLGSRGMEHTEAWLFVSDAAHQINSLAKELMKAKELDVLQNSKTKITKI